MILHNLDTVCHLKLSSKFEDHHNIFLDCTVFAVLFTAIGVACMFFSTSGGLGLAGRSLVGRWSTVTSDHSLFLPATEQLCSISATLLFLLSSNDCEDCQTIILLTPCSILDLIPNVRSSPRLPCSYPVSLLHFSTPLKDI